MNPPFPARRYDRASDYFDAYVDEVHRATSAVDRGALDRALGIMEEVLVRRSTLYVCGNGGSAAISNHLTCDVLKGAQTDTDLLPRVVSLSTQMELVTAIANDLEYAEVFRYQLRTLAVAGDALITISASGNSENVVRALAWARENAVRTIAMTGFSGGRCAPLAEVNLHVPAHNYGVVEDVHQSIMHVLAQFLRNARIAGALLGSRHF